MITFVYKITGFGCDFGLLVDLFYYSNLFKNSYASGLSFSTVLPSGSLTKLTNFFVGVLLVSIVVTFVTAGASYLVLLTSWLTVVTFVICGI